MAAMKIQDGVLVTSQLRYDSSNRFISRRLISGVSFMSISFMVFKKRGGVFDAPPSPGTTKKPSLNRVKFEPITDHDKALYHCTLPVGTDKARYLRM